MIDRVGGSRVVTPEALESVLHSISETGLEATAQHGLDKMGERHPGLAESLGAAAKDTGLNCGPRILYRGYQLGAGVTYLALEVSRLLPPSLTSLEASRARMLSELEGADTAPDVYLATALEDPRLLALSTHVESKVTAPSIPGIDPYPASGHFQVHKSATLGAGVTRYIALCAVGSES